MSTISAPSPPLKSDADQPGPVPVPKVPGSNGQYTDVIIAVHGIGAQMRNSTVRSVANRLAQSRTLLGESEDEPLAPQALGYFHAQRKDMTQVLPLDRFTDSSARLAMVGFTEVFWADIPQAVVTEGRTLEETKAWARTVVARAERLCTQARAEQLRTQAQAKKPETSIVPPDFTLAGEVLTEVIEAVYVLENLGKIGERAGLYQFDLRKVLDEYLGDVQIVAEFTQFRNNIVERFEKAMQDVARDYPGANLHIVAHSEGTVVSFLGLLNAMSRGAKPYSRPEPDQPVCRFHLEKPSGPDSKKEVPEPGRNEGNWIGRVRGYMTIGSPIDKHLLLWPEIFPATDLEQATTELGAGRIKWRNYYDFGDPVGFCLDTARAWLDKKKCGVFQFDGKLHDHGFARYLFPGKAHNDYWADPVVFEHFVREVIAGDKEVPRPPTRKITQFLSPLLPYVLSFILLFGGTLLFYRAVSRFMNPAAEQVQSYIRLMVVGDFEDAPLSTWQLARNSLGVALLIAGVTLLARWPRIARGKRWWVAGAAAFAVGCFAYTALLPRESRDGIGAVFDQWPPIRFYVGVAMISALVAFGFSATRAHQVLHNHAGRRSGRVNWVVVVLVFVAAVGLELFGPSLIKHFGFYLVSGLLLGAVSIPWWRRPSPGGKIGRAHV